MVSSGYLFPTFYDSIRIQQLPSPFIYGQEIYCPLFHSYKKENLGLAEAYFYILAIWVEETS